MRAKLKRTGFVALCLAAALSMTGCTALLIDAAETASPDQTSAAQPESTQQNAEAACAVVNAEWGWALDPWPDVEHPNVAPGDRMDFAAAKTQHEAIIADMQAVADKIEFPEVRSALDASISIHQKYADEVWTGMMDVPDGYVLDLEDPSNKLVILGEKRSEYQQQMADAAIQRYDLCGPVQNGQTGAQACTIVNEDWVDAGLAFNEAASDIGWGRVDEGIENGKIALKQAKIVLSQVTVPEVQGELAVLYDAYETYYTDGFLTAKTEDELSKLSEDELHEILAESEETFEEWDSALTAGEEHLTSYCDSLS